MGAGAALIAWVGTILVFLLPLLMLGCSLFLWNARSRVILSPEAREAALRMVLIHFGGLALFLIANAIPIRLEAIRVLLAGLAILPLAVVPLGISLGMLQRRMLPPSLRLFGWIAAVTACLLSPMLGYAVWIADQAARAVSV
ncbi:MAG: hypothetical protein H7Z41_16525 [Cytophagales bacterium]|nr:hypothetical protein [Armatimonadota bacterium]